MNGLIPPFEWYRVVIEPWAVGASTSIWIVLMGALVAVSCGLIGCFLVLRGMSLIGDAISHAVLPGIALAFLLSGSRASLPMFVGAAIFGVLTAVLIEAVYKHSRIKQDAAMGVVFSTLFAVGVILISVLADKVDLDQECVLYGEIAFIPLEDRATWLGVELGPESVMIMAFVCGMIVLGIALFYRPLLVASFDPALATSMGFSAMLIHYAMMTMLSLTIVSAFESVGAILVVSMLIAPAATAYLLTDRLSRMLVISAAHGVLTSLGGWHLSVWLECSTAGAMVVVGTSLFLLAFVCSPSHGLVARLARRVRLTRRMADENVLGALIRAEEDGAPAFTTVTLAAWLRLPSARVTHVVRRLRRRDWLIAMGSDGVGLTDAGREQATQVLRAHRLWETLLSREVGLPGDHLHDAAAHLEHYIDTDTLETLDLTLGRPDTDPHGATIPAPRR
ncbi:iron ABC transporter [Candidatus Poribacteria bacterium]|jgi:manganese/zinc/iron transport system permease protein|nr:iron ABC transporter [Candidatus Poribacteria bacterium]MBT5534882.1 iron ABC transporter [Candidatus Poribacteria bacterium]MBT5713609.1 iron ABC transporter [Candidatus Poribacteria bacterium]MBT7097569.1 iron ABC transporter [Candidatus Poribacteria bacterium]MBT7806938.1 iron ABC transporter [Candidatus Poribacteria bacterium]